MPSETFLFADDLPPPKPKPDKDPAQKLLDWLQRWNKPTVSVRDIRIYGPKSIRNRRGAIDTAEVLVKNKWLVPTKPHWPHTYRWEIIRKPVARPTVAP
jgi:hypothetical protein